MLRLFLVGGVLVVLCASLALSTGSLTLRLLTGLIGCFIVGLYWWLRRSLPLRTGKLILPGLKAPVEVFRDDRGVPHIFASNLHDLYMAQGYVTAQDRLWSMEFRRRKASGQLAEVLGTSMIDSDRFFRTLGLHRSAEASLGLYDASAVSYLDAYAAGVNARIAQRGLPPEFGLLGCQPAPWRAVDTLTIGKLAAYERSGNWATELFRANLVQAVGAEKAAELIGEPVDPEMLRTLEEVPLPNCDQLLAIAAATLSEESGSYGWVVSGEKTESGAPLLVNAPQSATQTPSAWYQVHLVSQYDGMDVAGGSIPGVPGVVLGHNREIAWGMTRLTVDDQDIYIEKINPDDRSQVARADSWETMETWQEVIRVKGYAEPITHTVQATRHGPLLAMGEQTALALRWTGLEPTAEWDSLLQLNRARSWDEFGAALRSYSTPAQTFLFAARQGTIGAKVAGKIPARARGTGILPVPGWTPDYEWAGYIPGEELAEAVNPPEGFLIALAGDLAASSTYRARRVAERVAPATNLTTEKMRSLLTESVNMQARKLLPLMLTAVQEGLRQGAHPESLGDTEKRALLMISGWDCKEEPDSPQPLLWHQWHGFLLEGIFRPQMGLALFDQFLACGKAMQVTDRLLEAVACGESSGWLTAEGEGSLSRTCLRAFRRAVALLAAKYGSRPESWRWGKEHRIGFEHTLAGIVPWVGPLLGVGSYPVGGGVATAANDGYSHLQPYHVKTASTWRQIVNLGQPDLCEDICAPGQCEHPLSINRNDQLAGWLKGECFPEMLRHTKIRELPCLLLQPAPIAKEHVPRIDPR